MQYNTMNLFKNLKDLKVACILDEFSTFFFASECICLDLEADIWQEQLLDFKPDLLFVESAWKGKNDKWYKKVSYAAPELISLVNWCKTNNIPTVYWNKEDPVHTATFIRSAVYFDYVFTTDLDCVPLYKRLLKHDRIGVLPFGAPVHMFNPIEKFTRKKAACFAGSYYYKQTERREDFDKLADFLVSNNWSLEIYDRNSYPGDPNRTYPEKYQNYIVGSSLPVTELDIAYKGYELAVTMNIVKHSSTMEARRAFELLSSNTLVISNPCLGLKNMFGDIILFNEDDCEKRLREISSDEILGKKIRLLGLRKVLTEHTYRHRLSHIYQTVFGHKPNDNIPTVCVYALVTTKEDLEHIMCSFDRQNYTHKHMLVFSNEEIVCCYRSDLTVVPLLQLEHDNIGNVFHADYYALLNPSHYYGANYLVDMVATTEYDTANVIGKGKHYACVDGAVILQNTDASEYTYSTIATLDRCIVSCNAAGKIGYSEVVSRNSILEGFTCLQIDIFNFCANFNGPQCLQADDLTMNTGISIDELYRISDRLSGDSYYEYDLSIDLEEFYRKIHDTPEAPALHMLNDGCLGLSSISENAKLVLKTKEYEASCLGSCSTITVFLDALSTGSIKYCIEFLYDTIQSDGRKSYSLAITQRSLTQVKVPEGASRYRITIQLAGRVAGKLKEILINPRHQFPIDLRQNQLGINEEFI